MTLDMQLAHEKFTSRVLCVSLGIAREFIVECLRKAEQVCGNLVAVK
jgi:hypothetical protein